MSDRSSTGGGSEGRRGFVYQDVAAAYFSLTDHPNFLKKHPTEFQIEKPSDFSFKISFDDYNDVHYFEVKSVDQGNFTWGKFKSEVLPQLTKLANEEANSSDKNSYHLVTNVSFNRRLEGFFKNTSKLREGRLHWPNLRTRYEKRNVDQIQKHSSIKDENRLASVVARLFGHSKSEELLIKSLEDFIRRCNSPGKYKRGTERLLQKIHEKDDGVLRKVDLEDELDISLRTRKDSTDSKPNTDFEDLLGEVKNVQAEIAPDNVKANEPRAWRVTGNEFMNQLSESDEVDTDIIDSMQTSFDERVSNLEDIKKEEEELRGGASRDLERAIEIADDISDTDNDNIDV